MAISHLQHNSAEVSPSSAVSWVFHYNDAFQNNRGDLGHLHNIPRYQNRNCYTQEGQTEACQNEDVFFSVRTNCLSTHHCKCKYHLPWELEFFGGSVCMVYNLHNDWFWRLCAFGITAEGNRSWRDLAYPPLRLFCTFVFSLRFWLEPNVVHLDLPRRLCGWNTKFPRTGFKLLSKFAFTCAKGVLPQNRWLSRQWLIARNMLKKSCEQLTGSELFHEALTNRFADSCRL